MRAYRFETTIPEDGELQLNALPFRPGEAVEIIVLALNSLAEGRDAAPGTGAIVGAFQHSLAPEQQAKRHAALAAIQSGKYARLLRPDEPLPSDAFSDGKKDDRALEERRWP